MDGSGDDAVGSAEAAEVLDGFEALVVVVAGPFVIVVIELPAADCWIPTGIAGLEPAAAAAEYRIGCAGAGTRGAPGMFAFTTVDMGC